MRGIEVDWAALLAGRTGRPLRLPTYPFDSSGTGWPRSTGRRDPAGSGDADFWRAVADEDTTALGALGLDGTGPLAEALPAPVAVAPRPR